MTFTLLPVIENMVSLYRQPRGRERFQQYINTLQDGTKGELSFPVSGFNPMAKEHVLQKLYELRELDAEGLIKETLTAINKTSHHLLPEKNFQVALNLSDDVMGGWTNRYTTDYDSKFKFNGLFARNFCIPVFWTSETFSESQIIQRTKEYVYRTVYWLSNHKPTTLKEHVLQERFVALHTATSKQIPDTSLQKLRTLYSTYEYSSDFGVLFNFFYGDEASQSLGMPLYGVDQNATGFNYIHYLNQ